MIADDAPLPEKRPVKELNPQSQRANAVEAQFRARGGIPDRLERTAIYIGGEKFYPGSEVRLARRIILGLED